MGSSPSAPLIEQRSFDYVPDSARFGTVWTQTQFWFMINATIITALTGAVGPVLGLSVPWTVVALLAGNVVGVSFQAFHGNQGPHLGLPQMIQSRVQFGSRGALIPIAAAAVIQLGFGIFNLQTAAQSLGDISASHMTVYQIAFGALAVVGATVGYRLILGVEKIASYFMVANLVLLTVAVFAVVPLGPVLHHGGFNGVAFIAQLSAAATYQIALAPIISDMTRYLPRRIGTRAVVVSVFAGTLVSAVWIELLGAVATVAYPRAATVTAIADIGDKFGFGLGKATLIIAIVVTVATLTQGMYSGTIAVLSSLEAFRSLRSTARLRFITLIIAGVLIVVFSLALPGNILTRFSAFLSLLGYLLIPWTAVNLTDYYLIRRARYSITDILAPDGGLYHKWNRTGLVSYAAGFVVMIPFFSTPLYTGPVARALHGADLSFVIGFVVAAVVYWAWMRKQDLSAEMAAVARQPLNTAGSRNGAQFAVNNTANPLGQMPEASA